MKWLKDNFFNLHNLNKIETKENGAKKQKTGEGGSKEQWKKS